MLQARDKKNAFRLGSVEGWRREKSSMRSSLSRLKRAPQRIKMSQIVLERSLSHNQLYGIALLLFSVLTTPLCRQTPSNHLLTCMTPRKPKSLATADLVLTPLQTPRSSPTPSGQVRWTMNLPRSQRSLKFRMMSLTRTAIQARATMSSGRTFLMRPSRA